MSKFDLAFSLISKFEGFSATSYICPAGIPTIGYGRTVGSMSPTTKLAESSWLQAEIIKIDKLINQKVIASLNANQMASLISFIYNIGSAAFCKSTLLKKLNKEGATELTAKEILRWNKANGKPLAGLTARREAEYNLFIQ